MKQASERMAAPNHTLSERTKGQDLLNH